MPVTPPSTSLAWALLVVAGLLEVAWAIGLKHTHGFTRPLASALTLLAMGASFALLAQALRAIPVGTGYAVWTGIGAAGTAVMGIVLFKESADAARLCFLGVVVLGVLGLKATAGP